MLHPDTELRFINPRIGHGVFATRPIPQGTVVWALDRFDRRYLLEEVRALEPIYQQILEKYCFRDREGRWIFCWDHTRYINHSFRPTCIATPYQCELAVVDIAAGQEITNDYGFFNIIEPFDCLPEAGCQRTRVMPDDLLRCAEIWDRQLAAAYPRFEAVPQPLAEVLAPENRQALSRIARGETAPLSIRSCYCETIPTSHACPTSHA